MGTTRNAEYTKEYNQKMFLKLLRKNALSRADIARSTGLTRASATLIADELLNKGWIIENPDSPLAKSGRPPITLSIAKDACYALGVYLNRDGCSAGIVSLNGDVICKARFRLEDESKITTLCQHLSKLIDKSGVHREKLIGTGISAPGPLDVENGKILNPPRFSLWHNTDIGFEVAEALQLPTYVENNASSLARYNLGKPEAHGSENFLLLLVDSGIGSGLILNGKLFYGAGLFTGELGHTSIRFDGKPCACGNLGCLEAYAAMPNLLTNTRFSSWEDVINERLIATDANDKFEEEVEYLTVGIVNLSNLLGIDTILLAGDLRYEGSVIASRLEETVNSRIIRQNHQPLHIFPAHSDANIKPLASADIVFDKFLTV